MRRWSSLTTAWVLAGISLTVVPARTGAAEQAAPSSSEDLARLRRDLEALRQEYGARMAAIESRIAALESGPPSGAAPAGPGAQTPPAPEAAAPAQASPPTSEVAQAPPAAEPAAPPAQAPTAPAPTAAVPAGAATEGGPTSLPVYGGGAASSKVFNPDIAAIGDFIGVAGKSPGGGEPSLEMHESELSFQAVVDPYARADFFLTFGPDEVGIEEAFITFPTLPGGFLMKVGKMRDAFGKIDATHNHVLPFIDRPLVSKNLLGGEDALADAGISVARLIPNPWLFLEATGQVYQGNSEVFKAPTRGDLAYVGHLRAYQDLGESTNIDLGGSIAYGHNGVTSDTTTRLLGVDATLRWRPLRRSIYTHLLLRGEMTWSRREQVPATVDAVGGYGFLEYQFGRRWFAGLRYDNSERADVLGVRDTGGSFILTYWPSEFSQVRGQYRHTSFGEGNKADEFLFQFIYAIGAHGAHPF